MENPAVFVAACCACVAAAVPHLLARLRERLDLAVDLAPVLANGPAEARDLSRRFGSSLGRGNRAKIDEREVELIRRVRRQVLRTRSRSPVGQVIDARPEVAQRGSRVDRWG